MDHLIVVNEQTLTENKEKWMKTWQLTEEEWVNLVSFITIKTWKDFHERGDHDSFAKHDYVKKISEIINGCGSESLYPQYPDVYYVNMGDPYHATLVLMDDELFLSCWGDVFEALEKEQAEAVE